MVRFTRLLVVVVVLALMVPACAPAAAQPTATLAPAPTAVPTITPDAAQPLVLVLPGSSEQKNLITVNRHYSDVVKHKGWNVDLYTVQWINSANGEDSYIQYIAKQLASGATRADGYFGWFGRGGDASNPLDEAKAQGLLYDCAAAAPQVVPDYWTRFQEQIVGAPYGLPLCNAPEYREYGYALALRKDLRGLVPQESAGYDDIRALLDRWKQSGSQEVGLSTNYRAWLILWLRQQGYMPLFENSGICTRVDDPDAKPVLVENVPGFESFLQDTFDWMRTGILDLSFIVYGLFSDGPKDLPPVMLDDAAFFVWPGTKQNWRDYSVVPLQTDQDYSNDISHAYYLTKRDRYSAELVIPARSRRSADAMAFVQWIYASRDNAECLMYGQLGEDFMLQGERVALSSALWKRLSDMSGDFWYGDSLLSPAAERRIAAEAPENAEALAGAWAQVRVAAPWLGNLMAVDFQDIMYEIKDKRQEQIYQLNSDLYTRSVSDTFEANAWIEALRQATPEDYLEPYLDALRKARTMEP